MFNVFNVPSVLQFLCGILTQGLYGIDLNCDLVNAN